MEKFYQNNITTINTLEIYDVENTTDEDIVNHSNKSLSPTQIERTHLYERFKEKITINKSLDRTLISNQANKKLPFYNWFSYKEGFSEPFVHYILQNLIQRTEPGLLLDPFSGSGSALFAAETKGWKTKGIELLPVGLYATTIRSASERVDTASLRSTIENILAIQLEDFYNQDYTFDHVAITKGAFPEKEENKLIGYISYCHTNIFDENIKKLLLYAAFCTLEGISYTRKDGQYLRWDARSGRREGKNVFNKGYIYPFREAIKMKLEQILTDLEKKVVQKTLFDETPEQRRYISPPEVCEGSCLTLLPEMQEASIDVVITSPPYANRYDYTRTYALELVYLGCTDAKIKHLRQEMLSCTVENKDKRDRLKDFYTKMGRGKVFSMVDKVFQEQKALQEVLSILEKYAKEKTLNNPGIATMVHNYFYEMCFVIYELSRILKTNGTIIMVNDNVRYAGEEIPVDIILSDVAEHFGLKTQQIWTLGRGKGNSSQQMGNHGRSELRKCVYVWEKRD